MQTFLGDLNILTVEILFQIVLGLCQIQWSCCCWSKVNLLKNVQVKNWEINFFNWFISIHHCTYFHNPFIALLIFCLIYFLFYNIIIYNPWLRKVWRHQLSVLHTSKTGSGMSFSFMTSTTGDCTRPILKDEYLFFKFCSMRW